MACLLLGAQSLSEAFVIYFSSEFDTLNTVNICNGSCLSLLSLQMYYRTRMWNMISSPATPTVCPEQKSENFQSHNVKPNLGCCSNIAITISYISVCCIISIIPRLTDLWPFKCQGHSVSLWCWPLTCNLEKCYSLRSCFGMYNTKVTQ